MKNKFLTLLLSVAFAFGLWMYVITVVSPESEDSFHDVPVVFDGIPQLDSRDLMITSGTNVTVDLKLQGNRTDLNKLDKTNITILADLSKITEPGEHKVKYTISYPSSAGVIEVLEQDPQYITVQVSQRVRKEVPVKLKTTGSMPENFSADVQNAVLNHKTVTLTGPEEVVNHIHSAVITVDLNSKNDTINQTCRHTLCGADGQPIQDVSTVTVKVSEIEVTIKVSQIKEVPLEILVEEGGGLTKDMVELIPELGSILVSGSPKTLENFNKIQIGPVKLGELTEDTKELILDIVLPQDISNKSSLSQVKIAVKMPEVKERTIHVRVSCVGVPAGYLVMFRPEEVEVRVRGLKILVDRLDASMIEVLLDLSNVTVEPNKSMSVRLQVMIPDWQGISLVNDIWVTYILTEEGSVPEV